MKITLCGSARFESEFKEWNEVLTLAGHVVYSLAVYPSDKADEGGKDWYSDKDKTTLDFVHRLKIENSDAIVVINPGGYVGKSTRREIAYATALGRTVYRTEPASDWPWSAHDLLAVNRGRLV